MENQPPASSGLPTEDAPKPTGVETTPAQAPDYMAELKARDERIQKLQDERDNYRKMGLKYKKGSDDDEKPSDEDKIRQIAQEVLLGSELSKANYEKDEFIRKMAKENAELKTAIANKAQVSSMPGGASQPNDKITVEKLAPDQKAELEAKARELGVDPVKFIANAVENLSKIK